MFFIGQTAMARASTWPNGWFPFGPAGCSFLRARLVVLASTFLDMAHGPDDEALRVLIDGFNDLQMRK
jgi:hypothetical protein